MTRSPEGPDTIVLIHGLWMTPLSWENWIERYEGRGYRVLAPSWPGFDEAPAALRSHPEAVKDVTPEAILASYERVIADLERPPILMGHSFGGAFVQLLVDRGHGAAGVTVSSATVRGIRDLPVSTLRSSFGVLGNPLNARGKGVPISLQQFQYAFANHLSEEAARPVYERYAVPAASKVLFAGALANVLPGTLFKVDFGASDRAPLLFIGGTDDHVIPGKVVRKMAAKYARAGRTADFREFPGRTHLIVGQDGWEEVADYALEWAEEHARPVAAEAVPS